MLRLGTLRRWWLPGLVAWAGGCASVDLTEPASPARSVVQPIRTVPAAAVPSVPNADAKFAESYSIERVSVQEEVALPKKNPSSNRDAFQIPSGLPGEDAPPILVPPLQGLTGVEREKKVRQAYPVLLPLPEELKPELPETGQPYHLLDLQNLALEKNPAIRRAIADVDVAYGTMVQAGLCPNPHAGYQGDQIQPGSKPNNNAGQQGAFIQQLIKTAGKLSLARAAAGMDYSNAQVALRRSQVDVVSQVRSGFFMVLVAQETMNVSRKLAELADEVYDLQMKRVASGEAAGYEPLQLYTQAIQARLVFVQAQNRYTASWKQLAANLGTPDLPPRAISGKADSPVPRYEAEASRAWLLENHSEILTAQNTILQAQFNVRLAQVTPIPDITIGTAVQYDNSASNNQFSLQLGMPIPVFDRNQGNIRATRATLSRSIEDLRVRQNSLIARLAEAFGRYQNGQVLVENYRDRILPNLVRSYRTIYQRSQQEPDKVGFNDIVVAQQNLATALSTYLIAIGDQWTAVVDIANLLQLDDLYQPLPCQKLEDLRK